MLVYRGWVQRWIRKKLFSANPHLGSYIKYFSVPITPNYVKFGVARQVCAIASIIGPKRDQNLSKGSQRTTPLLLIISKTAKLKEA
jgi:hypothetical protein